MLNWLVSHSGNQYYFFLSERLLHWIREHRIQLDERIHLTLYNDRDTAPAEPADSGFIKPGIGKPWIRKLMPDRIKYIRSVLRLYRPVGRWAKVNQPDIVHGWHGSSDLLLLLKFFQHRKTVYSITSSYAKICTPLKWIGNFSYRSVFRFTDTVEFLSGDIVRLYREKGARIRESAVAVAPCSFIDYSKTAIGHKRNLITFLAARFEPEKNAPLVVETGNLLVRKHGLRDLHFRMMGGYQDESRIKRLIGEYRLEEFFTVAREDHPERYLAESLVFLSLQDLNNYPSQALLEAMACGCAVIATDSGETRLLVNDRVGFLVGKDPAEIAGRILFLLQNREKALAMGREARNQVMANHSVTRYGQYVLSLYN